MAAQLNPGIVVPVFNAFEATRRCLESLRRHTAPGHRIVLVDDLSTDARIPGLLRDFQRDRPDVVVLENPHNVGFAASAMRGMGELPGDVVLLNSDTQVTAGWIEGLARCRASDPAIGIACPLSNNATLLTLEGVAELYAKTDGTYDIDALADCVHRASTRAYPRIPTAVGFCMLVSRELLAAVGGFDPVFGRGYGEENDLSMRALDRGFEIACCDDVYVHHEGEASFGAAPGVLAEREANRVRLDRRWPRYASGVAGWWQEGPLRPVIERINACAERERLPGRPRVLMVTHRIEGLGGIEEHTRGLLRHLRDDVAFTIATPLPPCGAWPDMLVERREPHLRVARVNFERVSPQVRVLGAQSDARDERVDAAFTRLLAGGFDVVHFQSLLGWNSLRLPALARAAGARVVANLHDRSWMCADFNMVLGQRHEPCGRAAARGSDSGCLPCIASKSPQLGVRSPAQVAAWIDERQAAAAGALRAADTIACPSEFAAASVGRAFGGEIASKARVLGHGVADFPLVRSAARHPLLRVAILGRFSLRKGAAVAIEAARRLAGQRITFESWGPVDDALEGAARAAGIVLRGPYANEDLPQALRGIDVVVVPTLLEESFCLALAEAQQLGIPVAASAIGAIAERLRDGVSGFLFRPGDAAALATLLLRLRDDRDALDAVANHLRENRQKTQPASAGEYLALYREFMRDRSAPGMPAPSSDSAALVRESLGFPRERRRTRLGTDDHDLVLDVERPRAPSPGARASMQVIEIASASGSDAAAARALNQAIERADAEWIVLHEAGDRLADGALETFASACAAHPRAALAYGDEDAVSLAGDRYDRLLKPRFSPELLRHAPYVAGGCAVRRAALLSAGGLRRADWIGIVDYALRLAEANDPAAVLALPGVLVHRLDVNLRKLDEPAAIAAWRDIVAAHLRRIGSRAVFAPATPGTPGMWLHAEPSGEPLSVLVRAAHAPHLALACVEALLRSAGPRVGSMFIDLPAGQWGEAGNRLAAHGHREAGAVAAGGAGIAAAIAGARTEWIAIVDAGCVQLAPGWLEHLEEGVTGRFVAAIAPDLVGQDGRRIAGWEVVGAGPEGISGAVPERGGASGALLALPREVSTLSGRLALVRRDAALASGALPDLEKATSHAMAHLCLALGARGLDCLARPFIAGQFAGDPGRPPSQAGAAWMRTRWGARLDRDPFYAPHS